MSVLLFLLTLTNAIASLPAAAQAQYGEGKDDQRQAEARNDQRSDGDPEQPRYDERRSEQPAERRGTYNTQYIFAATKAAHRMNAPAAARAALFPLTLLVDVVLLPEELLGGFLD